MAYEQRDNSGSLFKNDKKTSDRHPDYRGSGKVGGVEVWISGWIKKTRAGDTFMSLSIEPKEREQERAEPIGQRDYEDYQSRMGGDTSEDIPF